MEIIQMLLKAGADPHLPSDRSSLSPSTLAEKLHFWEIVQLFNDAECCEMSTSPSPVQL